MKVPMPRPDVGSMSPTMAGTVLHLLSPPGMSMKPMFSTVGVFSRSLRFSIASSLLSMLEWAQGTCIFSACGYSTSVSLLSLDIRANSIGREGPSSNQSPEIHNFRASNMDRLGKDLELRTAQSQPPI